MRVALGAIRAVAVDVRRGSPTFGRWVAEEISAANGAQFLVPRGFLHGFVTLTESTLVLYKVDNPYDAASDGGVSGATPTSASTGACPPRRSSCRTRTAASPPSATGCRPSSTEGGRTG